VAALGEFGLIEAIIARLPGGADVVLGPGDDAAVVRAVDGNVVVTTDLLVEGVHFRMDWSEARDVGHKAAAQNLADIAAMGARATALVVGLATPATLPQAWAFGLADGLGSEAARVGAAVVGGDVVSSDRLTIAVTALGTLDGRRPVTRAGAQPGDVVAVARHRVVGGRGPGESTYAELPILPMGLAMTRYHIRLDVTDRPGVLAQVALAFAEHNVSIETVRQQLLSPDPQTPGEGRASLVVVTHTASDAALSATVDALAHLSTVRAVTSVMRVEGE